MNNYQAITRIIKLQELAKSYVKKGEFTRAKEILLLCQKMIETLPKLNQYGIDTENAA